MTLLSPTLAAAMLVAMALLFVVSFIPLLGYKRSLNSTIDTLEQWSRESDDSLISKTSDKATHKVISLIKKGLDIKNNLKETQSALNVEKEIGRIIRQVAHDIRSPVLDLKTLMSGDFSPR